MSISGKYLKATIGATPTIIAGTYEWSVNETGDRLEATTGADNGRGKKDVGVIDTRVKVTFYFDVTAGVFNFIRPGTILTSLKLYTDSSNTNPLYAFTSAKVFDTNVRGQVRDRFIVEADIEAYGNVITVADPP